MRPNFLYKFLDCSRKDDMEKLKHENKNYRAFMAVCTFSDTRCRKTQCIILLTTGRYLLEFFA